MKCIHWIAPALVSLFAMGLQAAPATSLRLGTYLRTTGDTLGCYFTVESRRLERTLSIELASRTALDQPAQSFQEFAAQIIQILPHCAVVRSQSQTNVFHIIDRALLETAGYALTQAVTINYSGTLGSGRLDGLAKALNRQIPRLSHKTSGNWRYMFDDHVTQITISATNTSARGVLSQAVPIQRYSRIMWISETWSNGKSTVQFFGPAR